MALYTSTQDGKWDDAATWGGGGFPNAPGDTVEIYHQVLYNIPPGSAVALDWVKVYGNPLQVSELSFVDNDTVTLKVRVGLFLIPAGGANPKLTANNNNVSNVNRDHIITIEHTGNTADPFIEIDPHCDVQMEGLEIPESCLLVADAAGGQKFLRVTPGMTAKWKSGDNLYFHRANNFGSRTVYEGKIDTIIEAVGYCEIKLTTNLTTSLTAGAKVVNMAKSIVLVNRVVGQCGAINIKGTSTNLTSLIKHVKMEKVNIFDQHLIETDGRGITFDHITTENAVGHRGRLFISNSAFYNSTFYQVQNCDLLSCLFFGVSSGEMFRESQFVILSGDIFCNFTAIYDCVGLTILADMDFNWICLNECADVEVRSQRFYANDTVMFGMTNVRVYDSKFGWSNLDTPLKNDIDLQDPLINTVLKNVLQPHDGWQNNLRKSGIYTLGIENQDGLEEYQEFFCAQGHIVKTPAEGIDPLVRRGGSATSAVCSTSSYYTNLRRPLKVFEYDIECQANVERTFICYVVAGEDWSSNLKGANPSDPFTLPDDASLWLEAEYYGNASDFTHKRKYSTEQVPNSSTIQNYWRGTALTVKVVPKRAGAVRITLKMAGYQPMGNCYVVVDPRILIS